MQLKYANLNLNTFCGIYFLPLYVVCIQRTAWHRMVVVAAASLQWHLAVHHGCATDSAPLITSGIGGAKRSADTIRASTSLDGQSSNSDSGRSPNDTAGSSLSLLDKYTFRETIKKMLEEDHLPELPDFLDGIGLGNRLEVG